MSIQTFTQKNPSEVESFTFDFVDNLGANEHLVSATATLTVKSPGVDPGVASMLVGPPNINGTAVSQFVQSGTDGNYYYLTVTVVTSAQTLVGRGLIPVAIQQ